jgi:hypothetical protein
VGVSNAADPTIEVKTVASGADGKSLLGTFTVTNSDKLKLTKIEFIAVQSGGGVYRINEELIGAGGVPDVKVPVSGQRVYSTFAILTFIEKDGKTESQVISPLKKSGLSPGKLDPVDYGKLTNNPTILAGGKVEVATTYTSAGGWNVKKMAVPTTILAPVDGGRFLTATSKEAIPGKAFNHTYLKVPVGKYHLFGDILIENGPNSVRLGSAVTNPEVK